MVQVFLIFLTAVTFVLMAVDPRSTDSTQAKSAWNEKVEVSSDTSTQKKTKDVDDAFDSTYCDIYYKL